MTVNIPKNVRSYKSVDCSNSCNLDCSQFGFPYSVLKKTQHKDLKIIKAVLPLAVILKVVPFLSVFIIVANLATMHSS